MSRCITEFAGRDHRDHARSHGSPHRHQSPRRLSVRLIREARQIVSRTPGLLSGQPGKPAPGFRKIDPHGKADQHSERSRIEQRLGSAADGRPKGGKSSSSITTGGITNSTPATRRRKTSIRSCARSFGTAKSSSKSVSTAASVNRGTVGSAKDQAHGPGAMGQSLLSRERVSPGTVFGRQQGALGRSSCLDKSGGTRRHEWNLVQPPRSVKWGTARRVYQKSSRGIASDAASLQH